MVFWSLYSLLYKLQISDTQKNIDEITRLFTTDISLVKYKKMLYFY